LWHGCRKEEAGGFFPPWILKFSAKKGCLFSFEWEKTNFTTFGPPLEKSPSGPLLEKILPTPMLVGF